MLAKEIGKRRVGLIVGQFPNDTNVISVFSFALILKRDCRRREVGVPSHPEASSPMRNECEFVELNSDEDMCFSHVSVVSGHVGAGFL